MQQGRTFFWAAGNNAEIFLALSATTWNNYYNAD
jgi:hypothetical protein